MNTNIRNFVAKYCNRINKPKIEKSKKIYNRKKLKNVKYEKVD